ncbi:MAG: glycosyltransferase family 39 protein, partial [Chloroflexota bacterium]|nr:glycosyltransferase family 39 protein [Chloroflexota bacterium]
GVSIGSLPQMPGALPRFIERLRGDAAIVVLAGAGFLFTMAYGAYLAPDWDPGRDDQRQYIGLARGIVERGEYTRATGVELFVPEPLRFPGYPLFIAPLCVVGCSQWTITFAQALLVAALVVVVAKYATTLIGGGGGIIAACLVALNPSFAFFGAHALSDVLATVLLVGSVAVTAMLIPRNGRGGLLAGMLFAAATLTRPVLVVALPLSMLIVALRHGLRRTAAPIALAIVAFVITVAPYVTYAESSFGRPVVGSSGALLYVAYYQGLEESRLDPTEREQELAGRASIARFDRVAGRAEQARAWIALDDELRSRALVLIAHDPWGFAARGLMRSVVLWSGDVPLRSEDITTTIATLWRVTSLALFGLGLLGTVRLVRRGEALRALPLLVILLTWAASFPLSAEGRYSLPAQPFVAIGLAAALIRLRNPAPRGLSTRAGIPPRARSQA